MNGTCNSTIFLGPRPLGPWGGAKRSNTIKSELQSQFQRFLNQTFCVFSQMKDIKHIRRDFHSAVWVMPRGGTLGYCGGKKFFFQKFNQTWCVSYLHEWHMHRHNFFGPPPPGAMERGQKFNFSNMVIWHIKLKGKSSRPGYTEKFYPTIKLLTLG